MKLIKLTSRSEVYVNVGTHIESVKCTSKDIYINVESIEYMYEKDDCTVVGVTNKSFEVKEMVKQILNGMNG